MKVISISSLSHVSLIYSDKIFPKKEGDEVHSIEKYGSPEEIRIHVEKNLFN
jgi:hypothetical protein